MRWPARRAGTKLTGVRRASWLILLVALCFAAVGFGFSLGWILDTTIGRVVFSP